MGMQRIAVNDCIKGAGEQSMALERQIHIHAVDTAAFYTEPERRQHEAIIRARSEKKRCRTALAILQERGSANGLRKLKRLFDGELPDGDALRSRIAACNRAIHAGAASLSALLHTHTGIRTLEPTRMTDAGVISIFESSLTRTLDIASNTLSDGLIMVRVYYFEVFRDLVLHGFDYAGAHYVVLTASAGQIRTKKCLFIKESLFRAHAPAILCGLSIRRINACGGCNPNKYLSYLALCNSATEEWADFCIDRAIVVEDMELPVCGEVDAIDERTYGITRRKMDVLINHTDGCGMILPEITGGKNLMVRLPWIKGLLAAFPFDAFIREHREADASVGTVCDIYGVEHDILAEHIEVIFTRSQFKMWRYYESWQEYQRLFRENGCRAAVCNVEQDVIARAGIGYQMLQSLTDLTDSELVRLSARTRTRLEQLSTDRRCMLQSLGATANNPHRTAAQEALRLYPELLQDEYFRSELRNMKKSMERAAWAGKLDIRAKYLFVIPDLYAFCQWLFLRETAPEGLLQNGEVYAAQFPHAEKLDCLRSPSLYREHPVRRNAVDRSACKQWFTTRAIYTSCHDLISRVLQFDNDGDQLLVCADKTLIAAAERHMQGIVPLYYPMKKAAPAMLTPESLYDGMTAAYRGGNIGPISNRISKIWNRPAPDLEVIKWLCYQTNECIDYAKTLYKSTPPPEVAARIRAAGGGPLPHFFQYAKDKTEEQTAPRGSSPVDRLRDLIPYHRFRFSAGSGSRFDYRMLLHDPQRAHTAEAARIAQQYHALVRTLFGMPKDDALDGLDTYSYRFGQLRERMFALSDDTDLVVDAIIEELFHVQRTSHKRAFWGAFGDVVLKNLRQNLERQEKTHALCQHCLHRFEIRDSRLTCPVCGERNKAVRTAVCVDCGVTFAIDSRNTRKTRCDECQAEATRAQTRARVQRSRRRQGNDTE